MPRRPSAGRFDTREGFRSAHQLPGCTKMDHGQEHPPRLTHCSFYKAPRQLWRSLRISRWGPQEKRQARPGNRTALRRYSGCISRRSSHAGIKAGHAKRGRLVLVRFLGFYRRAREQRNSAALHERPLAWAPATDVPRLVRALTCRRRGFAANTQRSATVVSRS